MLNTSPESQEAGEITVTGGGFWMDRNLEGQSNWPNEDLFYTYSLSPVSTQVSISFRAERKR